MPPYFTEKLLTVCQGCSNIALLLWGRTEYIAALFNPFIVVLYTILSYLSISFCIKCYNLPYNSIYIKGDYI